MTPEEFERLKNEEKAHLRQLRSLKEQHRGAQRTASSLGALQKMQDALRLADETGAQADDLFRGAATQEARLDLALEGTADAAQRDADAETMRRAEAAALVARIKAESGTAESGHAATPSAPDLPPKTIGRAPAPEAAPELPDPLDDKTIGRRRGL